MGITGLLPFLEKKTARRVSLQELSGSTAAVDTYCWLHKGVFTCADKLAMNLETDGYVTYCMSNIEVLLKFKIKPILVFDGRHLPAKAETEAKRRENRETNRKKAMELIQMGEHHKGVNMLKRTIDVSHAMALDVMRKCQELNIDCIAAPYEADSQLAYLNISGIADFVITEDSDLTLFGCSKILFKMDRGNGCGTLVEQDKLHLSMGLRPEEFTIDKFRHMCILSGCDYLPSLPGIGLVKALKFAQKNTDENLYNALGRLGTYINKSISVSPEYRESFIRALLTFKHQLVYCPIRRKQVRLSEPSDDVTPEQLHYAGDPVDEELAYQLALGNCNPFGFKKMNNFDPDTRAPFSRKATRWSKYAVLDLPSIWSKEFKLKTSPMEALTSETKKCPEAQAKIQKIDTYIPEKKFSPREVKNNVQKKTATPKKRSSQHFDNELSKDDLMKLYGNPKMMRSEDKNEKPKIEEKKEEKFASPKKVNPFLKRPVCSETSPSLVPRGRRRPKITTIGFQPTIVDETIVTESRFFSGSGCSKENDERAVIIPETLDVLHEDYAPRNLVKEIDIQDELAHDGVTKIQKNVINTEDLCKVPVSDDVAPSMTLDQEEYEKNMLNFEEIRTVDHRTPRNSIDGQVEGDVIIPETPDDEPESSSSQSSCKENDNINVQIEQLDLDQSLSRSDSGVDMKEGDGAEKNLNQPVSPVVTNTPESRRQSSGLNITVRKYGLKSPAEKVERPPSPEDLEELFGTSQPINNSTSNFFRWGNTSRNDKPVNFLSSQPARTSQKKPSSQSKRRGPIAKKLPKPDSQQSVLNMFGFGRTKI